MGPPGAANGRVWPIKVLMSDMTFRQNGQCNGIYRSNSLYLALWDDVMEGSPHPKLNGYQRAMPGGACGAKGLGGSRQTPRLFYQFIGVLHQRE